MDAFDKYYLFDHDGNKMFSVTPHFKDGRHLVVGLNIQNSMVDVGT